MAHLYEELAVVASIPPSVASATTYNTDVVDMSKFQRALVVLNVGAYGAAGATINVQLYANTANSTSGGTAISGKTFAAATFSGSAAGTDKEGIIHVTAAEMEATVAGGRYLYGVATVGTNTVAFSLVILAGTARYEPASQFDLASVAAIIP